MNGDQNFQPPAPGGQYQPDSTTSQPVIPVANSLQQPTVVQPVASQPVAPAPVPYVPQAPQAAAPIAPLQEAALQQSPVQYAQPAGMATATAVVMDIPESTQEAVRAAPAEASAADNGFYRPDPADVQSGDDGARLQSAAASELIQWTTSDIAAPHRSSAWYVAFVAGLVALGAVVFLVTKDKLSTFVIVAAGIFFGVFSVRKPHAMSYRMNRHGIMIGQKYYDFTQFRAFSVTEDNFGPGIVLSPLRRFMPMLSVRYGTEQADQIVALLASSLPMEEHRSDVMDKIARTMRF